ncbi:MAG TPA: hydrogenase maturation protease [Longilinea sp.]|nr:hydrogenase maturation protease [Longilinea sp.]
MVLGKTIIIGLGNPILGDDSLGWRVAESVRAQAAALGAEVDSLALGGLALMERMIGYARAIVVDAIRLGDAPAGTVRVFALDELPDPFAGHLGSAHETNLQTALQIGRELGAALPAEVIVVAIESPYVYDFSEELSPAATAAVPLAAKKVLDLLK